MPTWVYLVVGFVVLLVIVTVFRRKRIRRIFASREGENFDSFRASFSGNQFTVDILQAVYVLFQQCIDDVVEKFPVRPTDSIESIYGMGDEDLGMSILQVVEELGRRLPQAGGSPYESRIKTVMDFARFIASCPVVSDSHQPLT